MKSSQKELEMKRKKGFYSISVVAKMFTVHQQTIRMYEKEGLIAPKRSTGNTRLFSEDDVDRLEEIIYLTHKMGINLAGVEMIFKLKKKMQKLQDDMNNLLATAQEQLDKETEDFKQQARKQAQRLFDIKKENQIEVVNEPVKDKKEEETIDDWQIEYDQDK